MLASNQAAGVQLIPKQEPSLRDYKRWDWLVTGLSLCAELANFGIFLEAIARWLPSFRLLVSTTPLSTVMDILDPLIYVFRSLIRIVRLIGRNFFNVMFHEEEHGTHPDQNIADIIVLILFCMAIATFSGLLVSAPFMMTTAWTFALSGLCINWYFDYIYPAERALQKYEQSVKQAVPEVEQHRAHEEFEARQYSKRLFGLLLVGLFFLLVCGSAVILAPPAVDDALDLLSKGGSVFLGVIGCGRLINWISTKLDIKMGKQIQAAVTDNLFRPGSPEDALAFPLRPLPHATVVPSGTVEDVAGDMSIEFDSTLGTGGQPKY